jgi:hypothetical protein
MSYITLSGHWCDSIVVNVHAPMKDETDGSKKSTDEELEHVSDQTPPRARAHQGNWQPQFLRNVTNFKQATGFQISTCTLRKLMFD